MSSSPTVDAVTFEMISHKLQMVVAEAMDALKNVSGSPSTSEALDMMVSLYDQQGNLMLGGVGFTHHITSAVQAVKHLITKYSDDPGIGRDDAYFINDPYTAALHAPDVYIVSPIHYNDQLIGFVANFVHVTDIGGIDPGGFCPNARDSFQEGFQTRGLKLIEGGRLRRDVLDTLLNVVREPGMTLLDIKSQLAANHVAKERIARLLEEFGAERVTSVASELIDQSERRLRARLREVPDGIWKARQYVDASDYFVKVDISATKEGEDLTYDFNGSSEQLPIGINCTYWAAWGALFAPIFPQLAWDLTWNEGITRPVRMVAPKGSIVNCRKPAPTSIATVGIVQVINNLSTIITSKMLGASPQYRDRATAVWHGSHASVRTHGRTVDGTYFISPLTDTFCGAGGATATHDGVDLGGELPNVVSRWGNVESHELMAPIMYLWRRAVIDSGGPGKYRGGLSHEFGITARADQVLNGSLNVTLFGKGVRSPMSLGLFGGNPGCPVGYATFRDLDRGQLLERPPAHDARATEHFTWGTRQLRSHDLLVIRNNGGGGYGDPLERDPHAVLRDVLDGCVSERAAHDLYGVAINIHGKSVDLTATSSLRRSIRAARVDRPVDEIPESRQSVSASGRPISEYLQQTASEATQCRWCGNQVSPPNEPWKAHAHARNMKISTVHPECSDDETLVLVQYFCPACATLLACEVALPGDGPIHDDIRFWPADSNSRAPGP